MKLRGSCLFLFATLIGVAASSARAASVVAAPPVAAKPLYRDPVFDGAADPVVIWNPQTKTWWMFYTNRRANVPGLSGVAWVHGTKVGIAESADRGATWTHVGDADIALPENVGGKEPTLWAPEVLTSPDGTHHMFLTVVPGVFEDWQHPRDIVHLTSADLRKWAYVSTIKLAGDRVIDPCVQPLYGAGWRMWYNNERDGKSIYSADSRDLQSWTDRGKVKSINARGEGPFVFTWRGRHWMLVDTWRGLGVYRSLDMDEWQQQPTLLLDRPGKGKDDGVNGGHPCVVLSGGRAFCFYFTHPGRAGTISPQDKDSLELRRSSIQVVELFEKDGWLTCDRDVPTAISLESPAARGPGAGAPGANVGAATDRDPADAAILRANGNLDIRVHDPSTLAFSNGEYWVYYTGRGIPSWHSKDLKKWEAGPPVFKEAPPWVAEAVPENRNANFWAPDVLKVGDRYLLYYSVSSFGKKTSAIALVTNATLDPSDPAFKWRDEGIVVRTGNAENYNAIDPAVFHDTDGKLWMVFGSFWSGIKLIELDAKTGQRVAPGAAPVGLAESRTIEAAFLYRHDGHYYLFVNHGICCRGIASTYNIRVGRSDTITGPYVDREGKPMLDGGGTVVAETDGPFIGPGHAGIVTVDGHEVFGCHFYDATQRGRSAYALRPLTWDAAGWPVVGKISDEKK
jgi:beta-xylosidase